MFSHSEKGRTDPLVQAAYGKEKLLVDNVMNMDHMQNINLTTHGGSMLSRNTMNPKSEAMKDPELQKRINDP